MTDKHIPKVYQHPDGRVAVVSPPVDGWHRVRLTDTKGCRAVGADTVPEGFERLLPAGSRGDNIMHDEVRAGWAAARRVDLAAGLKCVSLAEVIDTLSWLLSEQRWEMSNASRSCAALMKAISAHPDVFRVCLRWEDDPDELHGRRVCAEIESDRETRPLDPSNPDDLDAVRDLLHAVAKGQREGGWTVLAETFADAAQALGDTIIHDLREAAERDGLRARKIDAMAQAYRTGIGADTHETWDELEEMEDQP